MVPRNVWHLLAHAVSRLTLQLWCICFSCIHVCAYIISITSSMMCVRAEPWADYDRQHAGLASRADPWPYRLFVTVVRLARGRRGSGSGDLQTSSTSRFGVIYCELMMRHPYTTVRGIIVSYLTAALDIYHIVSKVSIYLLPIRRMYRTLLAM